MLPRLPNIAMGDNSDVAMKTAAYSAQNSTAAAAALSFPTTGTAMSAVEGRKTVCVTGGNGYIASALIKMLLENGYAVKTTVRNPDDMEKNSHLNGLQALGPLEVFRADMDNEGSFDEAVAGCDYAFLLAAPVHLDPENPKEEVIEPAVRGALNVLRSCVRAGPTLKRVVLASSSAAVSSRPLQGDGHVLDEDSWSDVEFLTANKIGLWAYPVSKVLMEKEARSFAQENGLSLVTFCPNMAVGAAPAPKVHTSVPISLSLLSGDEAMLGLLKNIEMASGSTSMVHVDDLCRAALFLAESASASGGRYTCCAISTCSVQLARFLQAKYPQYNVRSDSVADLPEKPRARMSSAKLVGEGFEFRYKTLDQIYDDVVEYGRVLGILPN